MVYFRKGQGAMEFLMAYGWAIIAVILTIAGLSYFGVINPRGFVPDSCVLFPGVACLDFVVSSNQIEITVKNGAGETFSTFDITVDGCGTGSASGGLAEGETETITIPSCAFSEEDSIKKDISIIYTSENVGHTRFGKIAAGVVETAAGIGLVNPGFEIDDGTDYSNGGNTFASDNIPDGWIKAGLASFKTNEEAHSGTYSQRYVQPSGSDAYPNVFRQLAISIAPGSYNLKYWNIKPVGQSGGRLGAKVDDADSFGAVYSTLATLNPGSIPVQAGVWSQHTLSFTVPDAGSGGHGYVNIYIYAGGALGCSATCYMFIDDVTIEAV